jgi:hypothetical protein
MLDFRFGRSELDKETSYFSVQKSRLKAALYVDWRAASMADRYFCFAGRQKCLTQECICVY